MSTMPAWVRLALLWIPRYFCSYFRSTLNGPCTLWNGRYKNKGLDALCDRITLLACCLIENETHVINGFENVLLTWFSLIFWSWQDGFLKTPKGFVRKQITDQFLCEILLASRFAKHFLITKTGAKRTDEFVKVSFIYSYFENGCRKNVHTTIPKCYMGYVQYTVPDTVAVEPTFVAFL